MQRLLRRVAIAVIAVMLSIVARPALAQTAEPTAAATAAAASWPLTLVWQTEFTPDAVLLTPSDIAVDAQGNSYISMQGLKHIKKYDSNGKVVAGWVESGTGDGQLALTAGLALDTNGNIYVADFGNTRIEKFDSNGKYLAQWPTESPQGPASVIVDKQGNSYVDNFIFHVHYIQKFDKDGKLVTQWGTTGTGDGQFGANGGAGPEDIALDKDGNVYVADRLNNRIQKFDLDGKFLAKFGGEPSMKGNGQFFGPTGIAIDEQGNLYVLDKNFLQKLDASGKPIAQWSTVGGDLDRASIIALDWQDSIYVFAHAEVAGADGKAFDGVVLKKFKQS